MNERDTICPEAVKACRKRANGKRGFTQQQLAEKIRCSKDTVSRWERGETSRVRAHLREPLCKALGVEWDVLTKPPDLKTTERPFGFTRMQRLVSRHVPPALLIVARRYGIRPMDVLDIAPLLFVIAAERSLLERRRRLD
ncbi:MAG: helix-turn-helix transcriptional regulator [Boseongicola sp. SB0670_bin_30]|nr:helix-turn-helix transcriptional regulator [Boseongicola sp. SB0670_bin_30]